MYLQYLGRSRIETVGLLHDHLSGFRMHVLAHVLLIRCEMVLDPTKVGPLVFTRGEGQSSRGQPEGGVDRKRRGLKEE